MREIGVWLPLARAPCLGSGGPGQEETPRPGNTEAGEGRRRGGAPRRRRFAAALLPIVEGPGLQAHTRGAEPPRWENKIGGRRSAVGCSRRVAMAVEGVVYFLHGDHLGSTVLTTDGEGRQVGEVRYAPYGATRWA